MFDLDTFLADVVAARAEAQPRLAVKEVLERAELVKLLVTDELTVLKVVWAPGMDIRPHDHLTWASIGIYSGGEDNAFFRREDGGLTESGGRELRPTDVCLLGDDTIHSVTNPTTQFAGAIHIYGGDFFTLPRSEWDPETHVEAPYDVEATLRNFEAANAGN